MTGKLNRIPEALNRSPFSRRWFILTVMSERKSGQNQKEENAVADLVVRRALQLFEQKPARRWTVTELAAQLGVSRPSLGRRFHNALGKAPLSALREMRLKLAAKQLRTTDDGLAKIAFEVGYDSEFAFSRAFTRLMKVRPGRYRSLHRPSPIRMVA